MKICEVIVDIDSSEVDKVFDYFVPQDLQINEGDRVLVPFGNRKVEGYVIKTKSQSSFDESKLKPIIMKKDKFTPITTEMLLLKDFMKKTFFLKTVDCLRLFLPAGMRNDKAKEQIKFYAKIKTETNFEEVATGIRKNAVNQLLLLGYMKEKGIEAVSVLNDKFSSIAVKKLVALGVLEIISEEKWRNPITYSETQKNVVHTKEQENAINSVELGKNDTYLLHGVTGSGKTEVYMTLIERALKQAKTAIMLVPEISLTPQVLSTFRARFDDKVALLHSGLSIGERYDEWRRLLEGKAQIAVGARSAIFAPLKNVGVIIIDEEHDSSYISDSNPRFITEDIALYRAQYNSCPLVLGSATPSIVSYNKAISGKWKLLELPERVNKKPLPKVQIVDMLSQAKLVGNMMFSTALLDELRNCINSNNQAMLFLNRRGYSSFMMCRDCGYVAKCSDCEVSLVYHKEEEILKCHYCNKRYKALTKCPECKSENIRQGAVGTEKIVMELKKFFPDVKILRMDNDTTSGKNAHMRILKEFRETKPSILVGTQMIAKGHDFPFVTLVGILDADQSLYHSDYRSTERTFQLITQVSGRAGRSDYDGKVILQTLCPRHYVYKFVANYNYKGFFQKEINLRQTTCFPPYSKIIRVLFSGENEEIVRETTKICYNKLLGLKDKFKDDFVYFDVMKSPKTKIMKKYRYQIMMRFLPVHEEDITNEVFKLVGENRQKNCSSFIEINPQNLS